MSDEKAGPETDSTKSKRRDRRKHRGRDSRITVDVGTHMRTKLRELAAAEGTTDSALAYTLMREAIAARKRGTAPTTAEVDTWAAHAEQLASVSIDTIFPMFGPDCCCHSRR